MKKRTYKEWLIRIALLMVGLIIAHLGVTLFLLVDLGSDPFNVLIQGIFRRISALSTSPFFTHGRVHVAISLLIIFVLLFADKSYIKIGTLLCMIFGGPIIDCFSLILNPIIGRVTALPIRIIILALGCAILAFGMTIVIKSDAGTGPNDLVAVVISDKLKKKFSIMRIIVDSMFVIIGWLLGGTFGIGTLICAALVGPVAGFFMPFSEKICSKAVGTSAST